MSNYQEALAFQQVMIAASLEDEWAKAVVRSMYKSGLSREQATNGLTTMLYMIATDELFYFPIASFERLRDWAGDTIRKQYISELMPTPEGMLVFENDIIANENVGVAYSAIMWKKGVVTTTIDDPENSQTGTALLLIYRPVTKPASQDYVTTPLLFCYEGDGEIVVTPSYAQAEKSWQGGIDHILRYFGLICAFMREKVASSEEHRVSTSRVVGRKRVHSFSRVKVVTLREIERTPVLAASEHTPRVIEWTCAWKVKQHERHLKNGKVVTVRSYTKNPANKPLREYDATIYNISR